MNEVALADPVGTVEEAAGAHADQLVETAPGLLPGGVSDDHRAVGGPGPTGSAPESLEDQVGVEQIRTSRVHSHCWKGVGR